MFDGTPTASSGNPVTSEGILDALNLKLDVTAHAPVQHTTSPDDAERYVTIDDAADVFDVTVLDDDIQIAGGFVSGIRTEGVIVRNADASYTVTGGTVNPIRQGALHIDQGDGITVALDAAGNDEISARLAAAPNRLDLNTDGELVVVPYTEGAGITIDKDADTIAVTNPFTDADESKLDALDGDRPIRDWSATTTYSTGEQVLFGNTGDDDFEQNTFSIYISIGDNNLNNRPIATGGALNSAWRLLRSGLVSVQGPDDDGAVGVSDNAILRFVEGSGINITRDSTQFTIAQTGTHHGGDVDDFGPGYAYSYFNLVDQTNHSGTVGARQTGFQIDEIENIDGDVYLHIDFQDPDSFNAGDPFAFRTTSGSRSVLFPNQPDDVDRIVYAVQDSDPTLVYITQVDPGENTLGDLRTLFNVPSGSRSITPLDFQNLFALNEHHSTPADGTAPWALNNNTDAIPGNKFESLSETKPTEWADGTSTTGVTIDSSWLPTITTTLGGLDDVTITDPQAEHVIEYLEADTTADPPRPMDGWYNVPLSMAQINLNQETDTGSLTGNINDLVHITGGANNEINFLAFQLQGATASLTTGNLTRALYTGQTSAFFNYTFSNLSGALAVNISNQSGTGSAVPDTANNRVSVTGLDNSTVNTFSFTITILDGTTQLLQQNRSVSFTDQRSISYSPAPPGSFDISSGGSFTYGVAAEGGGTISSFERSLNGGAVGGVAGSTSETITNQQMVDRFPNDFTIANVSSTYTNAPLVQSNTLGTRSVDLYRAFFFWANTTDPTVATDFDGRRTQEFAAGVSGLVTGSTTSPYYLAFPYDLEVTPQGRTPFSFSADGAPLTFPRTIPADPTDVAATFITRNGINYIVYFFDDVLPTTTFTVTQ